MIIELTRYEPDDGRHHRSPIGTDIPAAEHLRIDCVELWYTKVWGTSLDDLREAAREAEAFPFPMYHGDVELYRAQDAKQHEWCEAIALRYRGIHDQQWRGVLAVGYRLTIWGTEPPVELQAELGPKKETTDEETG